MAHLSALSEIDIGLESGADVAANQVVTKLNLGLTPRLPAVAGTGASSIPGIPSAAAAAIKDNNALVKDINNKLQTNMDIGNKQADALANAIVDSVGAAQTIALQADNAKLIAENRTDEVFQAAGGHAAQVDRAKDAFAFEVEIEALAEKRSDILDDKHTGIGIIDDVINGFRVASTENKLESTLQEAAINQKDIVNATAITQSAAQTNALVKQTASKGTVAANQTAIATAGQIELHKATMEQNKSNAATLQGMLANDSRALANTMAGFALAGSEENRQIARERFALDQTRDQRQSTLDSLSAQRNIIALQRDKLNLQQETDLAPGVLKSQRLALDRAETDLDRSIIALQLDDATFEDAKAASKLARAQAETNLDASLLAFRKAEDDELDQDKIALAQAQLAAAKSTAERAIFENEEFLDQAGLRLATREGAKDAQDLQIKAQERAERIGAALETGQTANALAEFEQTSLERADLALVRANNAENVQSFQSKLFGVHAMEDPAVIKDKLDRKNPVYEMMRQLEATAPLDAQGNRMLMLGSTPARSMAFLNQLEDSRIGIISNDITPVRILREVSAILQREDEANPVAVPTTEAGLAIRFNKTARDYMEANEAETLWNDVTNPLMPLSIPDMVELSKGAGIAAQPLFTKVLIPNGNVDANPDNIISSGLVALRADTLSQEQLVDGIVAWGNSIAINNNINHHGPASIGLPFQRSVNMRVLRPRGFAASVFDDFTTAVDKAVIPLATGAITAAGVLAAPASGGISVAAASAFGAVVAGVEHQRGVGAGGVGLQGSDFITLNIADPIAVRQHLMAILSSSTLGGTDTNDSLEVNGGGQ